MKTRQSVEMKNYMKLITLMVFMSFSLLIAPVVSADWWERGERPVFPRTTVEPQPTDPPEPTQPPAGEPAAENNDDPCAPGKSFTGDYCGWSPRIGGDDPGDPPGDPGDPQVAGLSYTGTEQIRLSDIMLLSGILCLLLYAKSKFTKSPNLNIGITAKRKTL